MPLPGPPKPDDERPDWVLIYRAADPRMAGMVQARLDAEGIEALVVESGSSIYPMLSDCGVHVRRTDVLLALYLVRQGLDE